MPPNATLAGRYRLDRRLGAGGMASVWRAHDQRLSRDVAVKLMADTLAHDDAWVARFRREARAAASLTHPSVVSVFDFGFDDDRPYIVMELIDGPTLAAALPDGRSVDPQHLARDVLDAVAHIHAAGIVHRDIKPANILLDHQGKPHITDFGIARPDDATSLTQTGVVVGTLRYLAPEVMAGAPATVASDLYAVGRVLDEVAERAGASHLRGLVERLTAEDPAARPGSAEAALGMLDDRVGSHEAETAPTRALTAPSDASSGGASRVDGVTLPDVRIGGRPRGPLVAIAAAAAIVLVLIVVLASGGDGGRSSSERPNDAPAAGAPADAPLDRQLDALDAAVDRAAR